jgi:Rap1a immunity proteins
MRHILFIIAAALPSLAQAVPTYQYDLTGDQFVSMLARQPASEQEYRARERAYSYLDGAKDATVGTAWCPPQPRKTHELAYDATDYIKSLHSDLRKGNAAQLLLAYLSKLYPCNGGHQ